MNKFLSIIFTFAFFITLMEHSPAVEYLQPSTNKLTELKLVNTINWHHCQDDTRFDCGMLWVPIDYTSHSSMYIQLPVTIHYATTNKLGTLITNFGGPWIDNVQTEHKVFFSFSESVQNNYDVVSFIPRGVAPNAIVCNSNVIESVNEIQRVINITYMNSTSGAESMYRGIEQLRRLCSYGKLTEFSGTKNTLQDMEFLRQTLQVDKLNYLGYSYGTRLGLAYLIKYPEHVKKMVLDSNMPANNNFTNLINNVAFASEDVLSSFFYLCSTAGKTSCALYEDTPDKVGQKYRNLMNQAISSNGIPTTKIYHTRPFSAAMLSSLTVIMINTPSSWPEFAEALNLAIINNNADALMALYIFNTGYIPEFNSYESYSHSATLNAVICKDYLISDTYKSEFGWISNMNDLIFQYPLIGGLSAITTGGNTCIKWAESSDPLLPADPIPITITPTPLVLLIGNKYDPRIPLTADLNVSTYLTNLNVKNKLLIWNGVGHTAYASSSPHGGCIDQAVNYFFASESGQLPLKDICNDKINPFTDKYNKQNFLSNF